MKTTHGTMKMSVLAAAVQGALLAMCTMSAHAEDDMVKDLTTPDNYVEIGVLNVDSQSAKFGEYTGLNKNGAELIGNFSIKGGDGYGTDNGLTRWDVNGSNLGLDSRELNANVSSQGKWKVGVGYDELQHNTTDGYQTPYLGSMGGNNFTLPAGFGTTTNTLTLLTPAQKSALQTVDVSNTRKNASFTAGYIFSPQWGITFDYNKLDQSGAKLMGFSSDGNITGNANKEKVSILPNPTNYTTETFNVALDWTGENGHLTGAYYGSIFKDHYDRVNWTTYWGTNVTDTMSTAPGNELHQFSLAGGYRFSPQTKLTGGLSRGRNTQNASYVSDPLDAVAGSPFPSSLNGLVVTTHGDAKLVNQTTKDLKLSASVTYNKRDNQTESKIYNYSHIGIGQYDIPNTPYSNEKTQYEVAGDYHLSKNNSIRVAYNHDDIKRWCNSFAVDAAYPAGTSCLVDTDTKEDKLSLGYKLKANDAVDLNVGYVYSDRKTTYDTNARVALDSVRGGTDIVTGVQGTIAGLNGGDYLGFHPYFDASRTQQQLKAGVNWQANDKLSMGVSGRYTDDNYDSVYGIQDGSSWSLNLDASYNYSEDGSLFAYVTQQERERYVTHVNRSNSTSSAYLWGDRLKDTDISYGLGFKHGGFMGGKLEFKGDWSYSDGKSNYSSDYIQALAATATTTAVSCAAAGTITCGAGPDISNKMTQLKLTGTYKIDKHSKVALGYSYQKLSSTDYFYNAYQTGFTPTSVLPTNQQSGSYTVNLVAVSYIYSFK